MLESRQLKYWLVILFSFGVLAFCKPKMRSLNNAISARIDSINIESVLVDSSIIQDTINYITGRFNPTVHPLFAEVPAQYASRAGMYLRKETLEAFDRMAQEAWKENIKIKIISATRNFDSQKLIWENKWLGNTLVEDGLNLAKSGFSQDEKALKILEYSSMPSTSRHHWGTDMDLNSLDNKFFESGEGKRLYDWLMLNASGFGFCQPYTAGRKFGYKEEKWHWSYLPIAKPLTIFYKENMHNADIRGFLGAESAGRISMIEYYVLGINSACK